VSNSAAVDAFPQALVTELASRVEGPVRPVVLIDGGSGAGKSTLGDQLATALGAQLVCLESIYPGWDGLEAASAAVYDDILSAENPGWRSWDWSLGAPGDWHPVEGAQPLVIEGSGSLSRRNRQLATFGIWVRLDADTRRARALARDGDLFAPHWDQWAAQEDRFATRERPEELADAILDVDRALLGLNTTT
jgi:hypothetical protein